MDVAGSSVEIEVGPPICNCKMGGRNPRGRLEIGAPVVSYYNVYIL